MLLPSKGPTSPGRCAMRCAALRCAAQLSSNPPSSALLSTELRLPRHNTQIRRTPSLTRRMAGPPGRCGSGAARATPVHPARVHGTAPQSRALNDRWAAGRAANGERRGGKEHNDEAAAAEVRCAQCHEAQRPANCVQGSFPPSGIAGNALPTACKAQPAPSKTPAARPRPRQLHPGPLRAGTRCGRGSHPAHAGTGIMPSAGQEFDGQGAGAARMPGLEKHHLRNSPIGLIQPENKQPQSAQVAPAAAGPAPPAQRAGCLQKDAPPAAPATEAQGNASGG